MQVTRQARPLLWCTGALAFVVAGCAAGTKQNEDYSTLVTSEPPGATVYASGKEMGVTPIRLAENTFPTRMVGFIYRKVGALTLKKTNCKPYSTEVNDKLLDKDIHVNLECGPGIGAAKPPAQKPKQATGKVTDSEKVVPSTGSRVTAGETELRLQELNSLYKKGLITDGEYRTIRKRILDSL